MPRTCGEAGRSRFRLPACQASGCASRLTAVNVLSRCATLSKSFGSCGNSMRRPVCEEALWLDVRLWRRRNLLSPGTTFPWSWSQGGKQCGDIAVEVDATTAILSYKTLSADGREWKLLKQRVPIEWTACRYGGGRPWFRCTATSNGDYCGRRVAILYLLNSVFACRHCYGFGYASQLEPLEQRGIGRARKIREQVGGDANVLAPFPMKPKRMHWRTYERLHRQYEITTAKF
jgi:hypothetical protein